MRDFRELDIWKNSHALVLKVYKLSDQFPDSEKFGLTAQIRRSSQSIPTNIAEGCGRITDNQLIHFCQISLGSTYELDYQLLLAKDLKYIENDLYENLFKEITVLKKQIAAYIKYLNTKNPIPNS
ncbi:four helix bundle protein [Marivirga atlantica]|jgi:four helix bundle protein|uniref:Four helix bundle protein n=1 Tax=Marivirga atlantica TaxID=1548457 RepID=A0A937AQL4_9BACT|nr:four helix bundle protein [Marivirga atlantica]MBL0766977.1 four helix bundle protein [Marivirga atlantica]